VNQYGPSETHVVTALVLPAGGAAEWPVLPTIGRPIANTQCHVLEPGLTPAPLGVAGELYLGGENVARGYLGRPGLTAERFVPDPSAGVPGARMYRSGDRARWLATGEVEFLGRVDQQVKVRGFRVEPGEVEAALEAHPAVRQAVVAAPGDAGTGERRLVGYVVAEEEGAAPPAAELRAYLAGRLPEFMVPGAFVVLSALPLTPSGKVDRGALPAPGREVAGETYVAPSTPEEVELAAIWAEVLGVEWVGVHDDFFALGGHSLLATRVAARVLRRMEVDVPLVTLFQHPTVERLAAHLEELRWAREILVAPGAEPGAEGWEEGAL
jgi:hypothetical protein